MIEETRADQFDRGRASRFSWNKERRLGLVNTVELKSWIAKYGVITKDVDTPSLTVNLDVLQTKHQKLSCVSDE